MLPPSVTNRKLTVLLLPGLCARTQHKVGRLRYQPEKNENGASRQCAGRTRAWRKAAVLKISIHPQRRPSVPLGRFHIKWSLPSAMRLLMYAALAGCGSVK